MMTKIYFVKESKIKRYALAAQRRKRALLNCC
jgi:hypothetical protein